ncbi:MAG TPA: twin-arginine translocase TatA/TatE family subunit [Devosia sp.]|nr:twin-arginine translocase TatA/TatE family subunit [Devosia sp.]
MLGLSWTEMLVIGLAALIFIGPKELPAVMNRVGKVIGQIRRMGNEFQREINKTTGLDEVRNLRNSLTSPLKKTADEIRREFNTITPTGQKPSGIIKPADPKVESVVDEIKAAAGMPASAAAAAAPLMTATETVAAPQKAPAKPKAPVKAKAAPTRPVITTELAPLPTEAPKAAAPKKPAARKTAAKPAPRKRTAAKPAATTKPKASAKAAAKPKPPVTEPAAKAGNE